MPATLAEKIKNTTRQKCSGRSVFTLFLLPPKNPGLFPIGERPGTFKTTPNVFFSTFSELNAASGHAYLLVLVPCGLQAFAVLVLGHFGAAFFLDGTHVLSPG
jgi:hypothetical protein